MTIAVAIFAHREERRIAACLASLPLDRADLRFHVLVNGSTDATARIARAATAGMANVTVHDLHPGGKARTWNRYVHDLETGAHQAFVFLDGDAEIAPGSIDALARALADAPYANAAAGMPLNGRSHAEYRRQLHADGGLFGDLYALSGDFVARMRARPVRLPDDLIGDDGLIAALAATDLQADAYWDRARVVPCADAGFLCEPVRLIDPATWAMQYKRMVNYSMRFFQNRIVSDIMMREGPDGLPERLAPLYATWLPRWKPRGGANLWFDRVALKRMARAAEC